jgi:hypothetical protein
MFRSRGKLAALGALFAALATLPAPAAPEAPTQVDVKLIIASDMSHSIDDVEAKTEREGIADVFSDPEVIRTIENGPFGRIAVMMLDWAGYQDQRVMIDWTIIHDKSSANAFSAKVRLLPRPSGLRTSISSALERAFEILNQSDREIVATRKVVDVSGDGPNNDGVSLEHVHETTAKNGIVVNGLPIMDTASDSYFPDLDKYYDACVVSGAGAFLIVVKSYKDFGSAMRRKLVREISLDAPRNPLLKTIASVTPQGGRQAPKIYPGGCDKYGGWGWGGG